MSSSAVPSARAVARAALRRRLATLALVAGGAGLPGCYSQQSLMGAPDPGRVVVASLNDRGRVALAEALGQNADQVEGRVTARGDTSFTLAVQRVRYFRGVENAWAGEAVTLPVSGLRGIEERRLSKRRTIIAVVGVTAALLALILTRDVFGGGSGPDGEPPPPPPQGS